MPALSGSPEDIQIILHKKNVSNLWICHDPANKKDKYKYYYTVTAFANAIKVVIFGKELQQTLSLRAGTFFEKTKNSSLSSLITVLTVLGL